MMKRFNSIARSACMQSEKGFITSFEKPIPLTEALNRFKNIGILDVSGKKENWNDFAKKICTLFCGPESGWAPEELKLLKEKNLLFLPLTEENLRVETAAIVGLFFIILFFVNKF